MRRKKICVEDCLRLFATRLARVTPLCSATLTWTQDGANLGSISFFRLTDTSVTLHYDVNGMVMKLPVDMNTTPLPWDSLRYWFTCPNCSRRVAHLYLPNGMEIFACRHCYNLTYRSSQTNSRWRRFFTRFD